MGAKSQKCCHEGRCVLILATYRMNILVIGPFPLPVHGCSLANQVLLRHLKNDGNLSVQVIDTNSANVSSKQVGSFSFSKIFSFLKSYKEIELVKKADVVYTTPGQTFFGIAKYIPFYWLCQRNNVPYIIHIHGNHLGNEYKKLTGLKRKIFERFISGAAAGVVLSESLRKNFEGLLPQNKVYIAENFALNEVVDEPFEKKPTDKLRLLYLGNLMKEKGILDVLDSFILLKSHGIEFEADIAGKVEDESQNIISHRLNQLKDQITYHGVVHGRSKVNLLRNANVFILPTFYRMEGQPISIIEAMAAGNIIITTDFSGIPDIVSTNNGFFVESQNPNDICNILLKIQNNLVEYVDKFSQYNVQYVKSSFTEEQFARKILDIISIVNNKFKDV